MKPIAILLVLLALGAGAWFAFDPLGTSSEPEDLPTQGDPTSSGKKGGTTSLKGTDTVGPIVEAESAVLKTPTAILLVGHNNDPWTATLLGTFKTMKDLSYASWFLQLPAPGAEVMAGPGPGDFRGLPGLEERPTAAYLEEHDIRAIFLDTLDPDALGKAFWDAAAQRIRSGRMGLYVRPNFPKSVDPNQAPPAQSPALTHPILRDLLPIEKALEIKGTPPAGTYGTTPQELRVTDEGLTHPATRLVADTRSSLNAWNAASSGEAAIGSVFVYPVESPRTGPQVLVDMENSDYPAIIVSGTDPLRVLWMGNGDFGHKSHFSREKASFQSILITNWVVWLTGQADG
jgi:hypothetical protein